MSICVTAFCSIEPLLAVSYSDGVRIFDHNTTLVAPEIKRNNESALSLLWLPHSFSLLIGWNSGCVTTWCLNRNDESDFRFSCHEILADNSVHGSDVTTLRVNAGGNLMVSGGSDGICCLWSTSKLQLVVAHNNNKDSSITDIKFWDNTISDGVSYIK